MTQDDKFKLAVTGDNLRALNAAPRTTDDMWQMLKDIDRADLKAEVQRAVRS